MRNIILLGLLISCSPIEKSLLVGHRYEVDLTNVCLQDLRIALDKCAPVTHSEGYVLADFRPLLKTEYGFIVLRIDYNGDHIIGYNTYNHYNSRGESSDNIGTHETSFNLIKDKGTF